MSIAAASAASPIGMTATGAGAGGACVHQHGKPLDPGGPADGRGRRATHFGHQPVIAPARHDRALSTKL